MLRRGNQNSDDSLSYVKRQTFDTFQLTQAECAYIFSKRQRRSAIASKATYHWSSARIILPWAVGGQCALKHRPISSAIGICAEKSMPIFHRSCRAYHLCSIMEANICNNVLREKWENTGEMPWWFQISTKRQVINPTAIIYVFRRWMASGTRYTIRQQYLHQMIFQLRIFNMIMHLLTAMTKILPGEENGRHTMRRNTWLDGYHYLLLLDNAPVGEENFKRRNLLM